MCAKSHLRDIEGGDGEEGSLIVAVSSDIGDLSDLSLLNEFQRVICDKDTISPRRPSKAQRLSM